MVFYFIHLILFRFANGQNAEEELFQVLGSRQAASGFPMHTKMKSRKGKNNTHFTFNPFHGDNHGIEKTQNNYFAAKPIPIPILIREFECVSDNFYFILCSETFNCLRFCFFEI